jgi:cytidine deaminase
MNEIAYLTDTLISLAIIAQGSAYAPYSNYPVGAALFAYDSRGKAQVFTGANVENAAYPLSICAERVAIFTAVAAGYRIPQELVVVTNDGGQSCGACRQVMNEFNPHMKVIFCNALGEIISRTTVKEMLPGAFGPENLK